jgi:hypothetical protein
MALQNSDTYVNESAWENAYYTEVNKDPLPSRRFAKISQFLCLTSIPTLALLFGGASQLVFAIFSIVVALTLAHGLWHHSSEITNCFKARSIGRIALGCLGTTALIIIIQSVFALAFRAEHPILGQVHRLEDLWGFISSVQGLLVFAAFYVLSRVAVIGAMRPKSAGGRSGIKKLEVYLTLIGLGASAIALSHWLTDNGKLFWTFAPEYVEAGTRARWPFVNPNHLAAFLLPLLFIALSRFSGFFRNLVPEQAINSRRRLPSLSTIVSDEAFQGRIIKAVFRGTFALFIMIAIAGTLSRAAWAACGLGLFTLGAIQLLQLFRAQKAVQTPSEKSDTIEIKYRGGVRKRRSGHSKIPGEDKRFLLFFPLAIKLSVIVIALTMLGLFLTSSDGASSRISERIEFGLTHTMSDIRWDMIKASMQLFVEHPLGVGLGGWSEAINKYLPSGLAGLNPVYLHSDPIQLLIEVGVVGVLPILFLALVVIVRSYLAVRGMDREAPRRIPLSCLIGGAVGLTVMAFFDFPFRITAVSALIAFYLAFLTAELDSASGKL